MSEELQKSQPESNLPKGLDEIKKYAYVFEKSGMFPDMNSLAQGMVKIIAGRELGIPPFASVRDINIIQGKPVLSANLMASLVKKSGRYDYKVKKQDKNGCEIEFFQGTESLGLSVFNKTDAERAGLLGKDSWRKHPRAMYFARALSQGARTYCPDVFSGSAYVEGEIEQVSQVKEPATELSEPEQTSPEVDSQVDPEDRAVPEASEQFKKDVESKMDEFGMTQQQRIKVFKESTGNFTLPENDLDWHKLDSYLDLMSGDGELRRSILGVGIEEEAGANGGQ